MAIAGQTFLSSPTLRVPKLSRCLPRLPLIRYRSSPTGQMIHKRVFSFCHFTFHMIHTTYDCSYFDDDLLLSL